MRGRERGRERERGNTLTRDRIFVALYTTFSITKLFLIHVADPGFNFDSLLFYGSGWALFQFDLLVFAAVDLLSESYVLAAVVAFIIGWSLRMLRDNLGRRNLGKKTLVDERFLI